MTHYSKQLAIISNFYAHFEDLRTIFGTWINLSGFSKKTIHCPEQFSDLGMTSYTNLLVVSTPLKNITQIGSSSQLLGKKQMFQTTNQLIVANPIIPSPTESTIGDRLHSRDQLLSTERLMDPIATAQFIAWANVEQRRSKSLGLSWWFPLKVGEFNWLSLNPRVVDAFDCYFLLLHQLGTLSTKTHMQSVICNTWIKHEDIPYLDSTKHGW